jgi:hypothetical protein
VAPGSSWRWRRHQRVLSSVQAFVEKIDSSFSVLRQRVVCGANARPRGQEHLAADSVLTDRSSSALRWSTTASHPCVAPQRTGRRQLEQPSAAPATARRASRQPLQKRATEPTSSCDVTGGTGTSASRTTAPPAIARSFRCARPGDLADQDLKPGYAPSMRLHAGVDDRPAGDRLRLTRSRTAIASSISSARSARVPSRRVDPVVSMSRSPATAVRGAEAPHAQQ